MSSGTLTLAFRVEFDFTLEPREHILAKLELLRFRKDSDPEWKHHDNRRTIRTFLANSLTASGVPTCTSSCAQETAEWKVIDFIAMSPIPGAWSCGLVSRTLASGDDWDSKVSIIFNVINRDFTVRSDRYCSMRVHVLPTPFCCSTYTSRDQIVNNVAPHDRKTHEILPSSQKSGRPLRIQDWEEAYADAPRRTRDSSPGAWSVRDYVNKNGTYLYRMIDSKYRIPLDIGRFNGPLGARNGREATFWIAIGLGFISQVLNKDWDTQQSEKYPDLRSALLEGLHSLGKSDTLDLLRCFNSEIPTVESNRWQSGWEECRDRLLEYGMDRFTLLVSGVKNGIFKDCSLLTQGPLEAS